MLDPSLTAKSSRYIISQVIKKATQVIPPGSTVLDYGGGKYDRGTKYFEEHGIYSFVYDPYNRSPEHNAQIKSYYDYAVCGNVLNVIQDKQTRIDVVHDIMKRVKVAFFTVYVKDATGVGKPTRDGWQNNQPLSFYFREIQELGYPIDMADKMLIVSKKL